MLIVIVFFLLMVAEITAFIIVRKKLKKNGTKKIYRIITALAFIIALIVTIKFMVFPPIREIPTTGNYQIASLDYWVDEDTTDIYSDSGQIRELQIRKWYPENVDENLPVIIASHGSCGTIDNYDHLHEWGQYRNNAMFIDGGNPLYTNIYYEGVGHMGLCDLSVASPLLSSVLSGEFQKTAAYDQLEILNEDCLEWLDTLKDQRIPVKVLILPKFEVDEMTEDFPGEAQIFYEEYLADGDVYELTGGTDAGKLYYKNGIAMLLLGQGKINAAINTAAVLSDRRFDYSDVYILSVGCGGAAEGYGIFGDVFVISSAVDCDLGYWTDSRELSNITGTTWFHEESYDDIAVARLDQSLTDRVFELVKDLPLETTENTMDHLRKQYAGEEWADRTPKVMRGTSLTSDRYWKGIYDHQSALLITETYNCRDPFAVSEMEDIAVARTVESFGMTDRLIILRAAVNMDVFPTGVTPEMLWGADDSIASDNSLESVDIFETAMRNCFAAGKAVIDAILAGTL